MLKKCIAWYLVVALCIMGFVPPLEASFLPSQKPAAEAATSTDTGTIAPLLEAKLVQQRLQDLGFAPEEVSARLAQLSDEQMHRLAQNLDELRVGRDGWSVFFGILLIAGLIFVIYYLLTHKVIIQ